MFSKLEFFLAFRYLLSKRKEGFISITAMFSFVGIMIGVATLIIVMSVMNGFRVELVSKILGLNSHLTIYSKNGSIENYDEILSKIKNIENVKYANAIVESQAMISSKNKSTGAIVKGIKTQDLKAKTLVSENILAGNIENLSDKNSIIIGTILAQNLNAKIGDEIKVITAQTSETLIGSIPRVKTYKVAAIFESGMYEYDATTIFMNFEISQIHFQQKEKASSIEILLTMKIICKV